MFYYLYQITNLVNAKIYVGVHKTRDMNDGYMGSGKVILAAIKKHGIENFKKDILETFADTKSMYAREKEVVTEEFLSRKDVYNLRRGGTGGFDYINKVGLNIWEGIGRRPGTVKTYFNKEAGAKQKALNRIHKKGLYAPGYINPFTVKEVQQENSRKAQSDVARQKRKDTMRKNGHSCGPKNSQFGTVWITNGIRNSKIKKTDEIPLGWNYGRI